ncbi:MAG: DUF4838 domain-containing protein [Ruminococcaceae bacterium]|nr:DUF4838 domain-containing protein [Oscillospiraceae bacterium]
MAKKIICMLLALSMMLTMLAACNNEPVVDETPDDGQQQEDIQDNDEVEEPFDSTLKLVVDGVSDYVIVRGENAYVSEVTASTELQKYLKQISGVEIPIVTDSTEPVAKEIVVGKTNREADGEFNRDELGKEGFIIKSTGSKLWLVGGELRGTLYSVYSFLEEYLGVRYYTSTVEKVPEMKTIELDKIEENKQIPVFTARLSDWLPKNPEWSVKQKINDNTHVKLSEEVGGGIAYPGQNHSGEFVHSMQFFVPYSQYKDTHPEYFAVDKNGNIRENGNWTQTCLSNPDVLQITIDGVRKMLAEKPYVNYISVSENDNHDTCQCEKCAQTDAEEGGHAGTMLRFVNAIADNIKDDYPDVMIDALAYFATIDAPTITKPRENVIVRMAPIEQCIVHGTEECQEWWKSEYTGKSTYQMLKEWSDVGCELFIWDYSNNFAESTLPWPSLYPLKEDCKMYADHNVTGIFFQGNSYSVTGEFGELRCYLLAKLFWNPYMSDEEFEYHINDFLEGFYGEGWQHIRAYMDSLMKAVEGKHMSMNPDAEDIFDMGYDRDATKPLPEELTADHFINPENYDWSPYYEYYTKLKPGIKEFIDEAYANFEAAEALAKDQAELDRIKKTKIQVGTLEISYLQKLSIRGNFLQLCKNFFNGNDDYTQDEITNIRNEFLQFAMDIHKKIITDAGSVLFDEMKKYGVGANPASTNLSHSKEEADLSAIPEEWIPWH